MTRAVNLAKPDLEIMLRFVEQCLEASRKESEYLKNLGIIDKSEFYAKKLEYSRIEEIILRLK